ncbi:TPA: phage tail protein, partial [Escherichia coli]|nr:phage tail protein [Escherichia coli]
NGRWHVMQRVAGKNRYPIDVVKIPMAAPLKQAFDENVDRIRRERLPKELASALKQQLRIAIKR